MGENRFIGRSRRRVREELVFPGLGKIGRGHDLEGQVFAFEVKNLISSAPGLPNRLEHSLRTDWQATEVALFIPRGSLLRILTGRDYLRRLGAVRG